MNDLLSTRPGPVALLKRLSIAPSELLDSAQGRLLRAEALRLVRRTETRDEARRFANDLAVLVALAPKGW